MADSSTSRRLPPSKVPELKDSEFVDIDLGESVSQPRKVHRRVLNDLDIEKMLDEITKENALIMAASTEEEKATRAEEEKERAARAAEVESWREIQRQLHAALSMQQQKKTPVADNKPAPAPQPAVVDVVTGLGVLQAGRFKPAPVASARNDSSVWGPARIRPSSLNGPIMPGRYRVL